MINSMIAVRCELRPDEELRMMPEIKVPSTEGFSLDRKSSYSISLTPLWLCGSYVRVVSCQESWNGLPGSERREQLMHNIVLIQFGLNILQSNIAKSGQANLCE